jgi:hypothetical protein
VSNRSPRSPGDEVDDDRRSVAVFIDFVVKDKVQQLDLPQALDGICHPTKQRGDVSLAFAGGIRLREVLHRPIGRYRHTRNHGRTNCAPRRTEESQPRFRLRSVFACASVLQVNVLGAVAAVILDPAVPHEVDPLADLQQAIAMSGGVGEVDGQHAAVLWGLALAPGPSC